MTRPPCGRVLHGVHQWVQMKKGLPMNQAGFLDEPDMRMTCCIDVCISIYIYSHNSHNSHKCLHMSSRSKMQEHARTHHVVGYVYTWTAPGIGSRFWGSRSSQSSRHQEGSPASRDMFHPLKGTPIAGCFMSWKSHWNGWWLGVPLF